MAAARARAGISQPELAAAVSRMMGKEITPTRIANYEQGVRTLRVEMAPYIARALGVTPSYLYGFEDAAQSPEELALLNKYRMTDDRGRKVIHGVADNQPAAYEAAVDTSNSRDSTAA
jgi:transcriptional regulator with XRE-family HTH domain